MADISALYPQPQPQPANQGALSADPTKVIGVLGALQDFRLKREQFDALAQEPAARLQGQQILNATGQLEQEAKRKQILAHHFGVATTPEDMHGLKANAAIMFPDIPVQTINAVADIAQRDPKGFKNGIATLRLLAAGPENLTARSEGPPSSVGRPTSVPTPEATRAGAMEKGLSPKEQAAGTTTGAGAGSAVNEARTHGLNFQQQVFPLESAIPALEKLGKTGTGPGTETFNHVKSFLSSAGIPGIDVDKIKNFDEAKKYLTDFVNQNGNSGTNDKLAAAFAGNPSVNISNAAATDVAKSALALRRFKQAQLVAFEKGGKSDEDFPKEAGKWARDHDPRVYGFDLMTPKQRRDVLASLPESKRQLFQLDVQDAVANGIIKGPK